MFDSCHESTILSPRILEYQDDDGDDVILN